MKKPVFIVDYACGFHPNTCDVDHVSVMRTKAALRAFKEFPHSYIVLGAGMSEATGHCGPLADMMEKSLLEQGVPADRILKNPHGHDTLSESEFAYEIIRKKGGAKRVGSVICATSAYHAPRVWLIWALRFGIFPTIYTTKLKPSAGERRKEIEKIVPEMFRAIARRF